MSLGTRAPTCEPDAVMWKTSRSVGVAKGEVPAVGVVAARQHDRAARVAHQREDPLRRPIRLACHAAPFRRPGPAAGQSRRLPSARTRSPRSSRRAPGPRLRRREARPARPSRATRSTRPASSRNSSSGHTVVPSSIAIGSRKKRSGSQSSLRREAAEQVEQALERQHAPRDRLEIARLHLEAGHVVQHVRVLVERDREPGEGAHAHHVVGGVLVGEVAGDQRRALRLEPGELAVAGAERDRGGVAPLQVTAAPRRDHVRHRLRPRHARVVGRDFHPFHGHRRFRVPVALGQTPRPRCERAPERPLAAGHRSHERHQRLRVPERRRPRILLQPVRRRRPARARELRRVRHQRPLALAARFRGPSPSRSRRSPSARRSCLRPRSCRGRAGCRGSWPR